MIGWERLKSGRIVDAQPGPVGEIPEEDKHPYVPPLKLTNDLSPDQQKTVKYFNSIRKMLIDHNLMQQKNGGA